MKKIEELMNISENSIRIDCLINDLRRGKLICFFGAGLSLGKNSKNWGYPFTWTIGRILDVLVYLVEKYKKTDYKDGLEQVDECMEQLAEIENMCKQGEFLEAGYMLNELVRIVYKILNARGEAQIFNYKTFNEACVQAFKEDDFSDIEKNFESPYLIPAAFYLPYLGGKLVTTNVDESFNGIISRLDIPWHKYIIGPYEEQHEWEINSIFYLHGNIKDPSSLVMEKQAYDNAYPEQIDAYRDISGARSLLIDCAQNYSILFLGASLQQDRTVLVINRAYDISKRERENDNLHYVPIVPANEHGILNKIPQIDNFESIQYSKDYFFEIPTILLQMIRQTKEWYYCSWKEVGKDGNENNLTLETKRKISDFLSSDEKFSQIDFSHLEINPTDLLCYLYNQYSIVNHGKDELGWSICRVTHNEFSLEAAELEPFPLHNYPLGDTIYILADSGMTRGGYPNLDNSYANRINQMIKSWRTEIFPSYLDENGDILESTFSPRVRVIILDLPLPYNELNQNYKNSEKMLEQLKFFENSEEVTVETYIEILIDLYHTTHNEASQQMQLNENDSFISAADEIKRKNLIKRNED